MITLVILLVLCTSFECTPEDCFTFRIQAKNHYTTPHLTTKPNLIGIEYPPFGTSPTYTSPTSLWLCSIFPISINEEEGTIENCIFSPTLSTSNGFFGLHVLTIYIDNVDSVSFVAYQNTYYDTDRQDVTGQKLAYTGTTTSTESIYLADLAVGVTTQFQSGYCQLNWVADFTTYPTTYYLKRFSLSCGICISRYTTNLFNWVRCVSLGSQCPNSNCCPTSLTLKINQCETGTCVEKSTAGGFCSGDGNCATNPDPLKENLCINAACVEYSLIGGPCNSDNNCKPSTNPLQHHLCQNSICVAMSDTNGPCTKNTDCIQNNVAGSYDLCVSHTCQSKTDQQVCCPPSDGYQPVAGSSVSGSTIKCCYPVYVSQECNTNYYCFYSLLSNVLIHDNDLGYCPSQGNCH